MILRQPLRAATSLLPLLLLSCNGDGSGPRGDPREKLFFLSARDGGVGAPGRPVDDVYRMDADSTAAENLSRSPGLYRSISVSQDGRRVAYANSTCDIWVRNVDWSSPLKLTNRDGGNSDRCAFGPQWSKDGALIAFASNRANRRVGTTSGLYDVYVMNADGSNVRKVSNIPVDRGFAIGILGWSPGGQVVFQTYDVVGNKSAFQVYMVNADGTGMRTLFSNETDHNPAWAPDGSMIVFNRMNAAESQELYIMNADGSGVRSLTGTSGRDRLDGVDGGIIQTTLYSPWSPDSRLIVFQRWQGNDNGALYVIDTNGSGLRRLAPSTSSFNGWAPLRRRIAFTSDGGTFGSPTEIYTIDYDGTGLRNLTNHPSYDSQAFWYLER